MTKPSYWICGAGSDINCLDWDDVNGCWQNQHNVESCCEYCRLRQELMADEDIQGDTDEI